MVKKLVKKKKLLKMGNQEKYNMAGERKTFFRERTESEIKELNRTSVNHQNDLVERVDGLSAEDGLVIYARITPNSFFRGGASGKEASRKCYKHGDYISLPQPKTLEEAYASRDIPLNLRTRAFFEAGFRKKRNGIRVRKRQEEISNVGVCWRPLFGRVKPKILVPFREVVEGARLFSYAENYSTYNQGKQEKQGIEADIYKDAGRVSVEGAGCVVVIPSRTEKKPRYRFGVMHVPLIPNNPDEGINYNLAIALSMRPALLVEEETGEPVVGRTAFSDYLIKYKFLESREGSDALHLAPQDIAGFLGILKRELTESHNQTPLTFNPYPLPSQHQARFYAKLRNNVLIFDPTLESKDKLRKLHLDEVSILLGRAIDCFGQHDFAYWDPTRDGIYKNYNWSA